jgi:hydroxymethylpyrimidine/phosphomethylpyrimidine kinase
VQPSVALTVAGSDSGGGAGIQADLRTFAAFGLHGTSAITAVTAQNTLGVAGVAVLTPDEVAAQVRAVVGDFAVRATKTGMLATPEIVERVAALAAEGVLAPLVVDPVLVATSGDVLMKDGGVRAYREALFPHATLVTPNLAEAATLVEVDPRDVRTLEDLVALARAVGALGPAAALVKGGHLRGLAHSPDVLVIGDEVTVLDAARVDTANDHGTGCSLSAAAAAGLALGRSTGDAVRDAKSFVLAALEGASSWRLGHGRGPIDHLGWGA